MKAIASKLSVGIAIFIFLFFGLKGCVMTTWSSPNTPTTYAVHGIEGRSLMVIFLPKHESVLVYTDERNGFVEAELAEMRGTYGTHYFWRLWSINGPGIGKGLLGYRIYPGGSEPVVMEMIVKKKIIHGASRPILRNEGDRTYPVILFAKDAIRFEGMWLKKEPTPLKLVHAIEHKLKAK